ncbi:CoA transferase [Diaphorobacter sp. HDW4A]|uniref:CaiB/BaiF CoA transferase family protein n=1 Tax=Diaphorobacter sp. HDW4A TaxID=2714924 RepID=UPI0014093512|nr:CoA transferase [Diaphorobacter sp. HDW4A]QIL82861.1 CoA transferase [Diaphorobacter sp. HDW4A]
MTSPSTAGFSPLAGFKVLDLSQGVAGPYCAQLLCHQGAEVIKIEPPQGDWGRHVGVARNGHSTLSNTFNSGKLSVAVDARQPQGKALILELARKTDVVIQSFRPQVMQRLGLDPASLAAEGIDPVYVSISGYGADGPFAEHPATDSVMQADSGLMNTNRDASGTPQRVGLLLADIATGVYAAQACTAALLHKLKTGRGTHVELNLFNVCCALQSSMISDEVIAKQLTRQAVSAPNGIFQAADGQLTILALNTEHFERICSALDLPHWKSDPRFATNDLRLQHRELLHAEMALVVLTRTVDDLAAVLTQHSVLHARVRTAQEVVDHPQAMHLTTFNTLHQPGFGDMLMSATPWKCHGEPPVPSPQVGEHTWQVLGSLGLEAVQIQVLADARIIALGGLPTEPSR